jgi:hypothetical protein
VKGQAGQGENSTRSSKPLFYVSKTLSRNPQDSAISLKEFNFEQKGILIEHKKKP